MFQFFLQTVVICFQLVENVLQMTYQIKVVTGILSLLMILPQKYGLFCAT